VTKNYPYPVKNSSTFSELRHINTKWPIKKEKRKSQAIPVTGRGGP
jgi:hypothetical protein